MKGRLLWLVLFYAIISLHSVISGQQPSSDSIKVVVVPREVGLITVANQPDCPLQFENISWLAGIEGGGAPNYDLRNRGLKAIRAFKVGDSTGSTWSWDVARYHGPVTPGATVPTTPRSVQIVPLTNELRGKLKLEGTMHYLLVLMVIRVEFTDGTAYDDEN